MSLKRKSVGILNKLGLVIAISLLAQSCTGQSVWESSVVKGKTSTFNCQNLENKIHITNINYKDPRETRIQYDNNRLDFSYVSIISHEDFLEAFKHSFTDSRIAQLAEVNDFVSMVIHVDEKGQILGIYFTLDPSTTIIPEELELFEKEVFTRVKFEVIGKKVDDLIFHSVYFRIHFNEVQNGELRMVRGSVKLKNRY